MGPIGIKRLYPDVPTPAVATERSVGFDLRAFSIPDDSHMINRETWEEDGKFILEPRECVVFGCGIKFEIPDDMVMDIRSRSGLAARNQIFVLNAPGTIDPDFRGEVGIILQNNGKKNYTISRGDKIAQAIFHNVEVPCFIERELTETERGDGGFGSTGEK